MAGESVAIMIQHAINVRTVEPKATSLTPKSSNRPWCTAPGPHILCVRSGQPDMRFIACPKRCPSPFRAMFDPECTAWIPTVYG
jgi:hypothetical protein